MVDLIAARAEEAFIDLPSEVRIEREYETSQLFFRQHNVALKFNQCDENYRIHPPGTDRACSFLTSPLLFPADEIDLPSGCITLFGVYGLNRARTEVQRVAITLQSAEEVLWKKDLPAPPADGQWAIVKPSAPQAGPAIIDLDEQSQTGNE